MLRPHRPLLAALTTAFAAFLLACSGVTSQSSSNSPGRGEEGYLQVPGESWVWVAVGHDHFKQLNRLAAARDEAGIRRMIAADQVLQVQAGTKVKVIELWSLSTEVQILEGAHQGKSGNVSTEFVRK